MYLIWKFERYLVCSSIVILVNLRSKTSIFPDQIFWSDFNIKYDQQNIKCLVGYQHLMPTQSTKPRAGHILMSHHKRNGIAPKICSHNSNKISNPRCLYNKVGFQWRFFVSCDSQKISATRWRWNQVTAFRAANACCLLPLLDLFLRCFNFFIVVVGWSNLLF
jgi:hypothetical protein